MANYFRKQPLTLKHPDNTCSKTVETVTSDHDLSGNYHVYDWLLSILNFEQNILEVEFTIDSKIFAHKQTLNSTFASAVQLVPEYVCRRNLF